MMIKVIKFNNRGKKTLTNCKSKADNIPKLLKGDHLEFLLPYV